MMSMTISYESTGRVNQKARTREALIGATRELIAAGATPTVESAARQASISRATAYRYFPNQHELLVASHPEVERKSMLPTDPPSDPAARLDVVVDELVRLILDSEVQLRTTLRLSLDPDPASRGKLELRKGRAIAWIGEALAPLRGEVPDAELRRLVLAIRSAVGIEALVWLTDVAGLSRKQAAAQMRWSARRLLEGVLSAPR
jgi:AcrR family transcriptional regulator